MSSKRLLALSLLGLIGLFSLAAEVFAPAGYDQQFRDQANARPSRTFLLGSDELGRDRLSRLLYGSRVSLLLAPAAAALSTALAALIGLVAATKKTAGAWLMAITDLVLSMPWLLLLITVRALIPLNVSPWTSVSVTFLLLGALGWAASARVVSASTRSLLDRDFMILARATGARPWRRLWVQLLPNVAPALWAQFLISIPVFLLTEANLSMLGLGVSEPLPSLGGMLRELEGYGVIRAEPWRLAPLVFLVAAMSGFQLLLSDKEVTP